MDFGGLLAGAMAGGGKAIQENAQNQLEQQRQTALLDIERKYNRENLDYEYNLKGDIAQQEAAADAAQAAIDRQAQLERIAAEGNQERLTAAENARLEAEYGTGADTPAKVQEIEYLTDNVTGGDRNMATQIAYRTSGDFSYGDAYQLVSDSVENMSPSERRQMTPDEITNRADKLFQRVREMDSFGGAPAREQSGVMGLGNNSSMSTLPNSGSLPLGNSTSNDRPDPFGIRN